MQTDRQTPGNAKVEVAENLHSLALTTLDDAKQIEENANLGTKIRLFISSLGNTTMTFRVPFLFTFCLLGLANGFVPISTSKPSLIPLNMDAAAVQDIEVARTAFVLCFAGAVGSAAVGREAIPVTWREYWKVQALKGQGKSLGGAELDLFGYPEPVYANDVMAVLSNNMTVYDMMEEYPIDGQIPGYFRYESLAQANAETSQMAVRAVFDAIAVGINKNQVAPQVAVAKMEEFKNDLELVSQNSRFTKTIGVTALVLLLSILGAADFFAVYHLQHGWFPEWQGFTAMPGSLFDDRGISSLMANFIADVPAPDLGDAFPMN